MSHASTFGLRRSAAVAQSYQKAGPYIKNPKLADPDSDNEISETEFMNACKEGLVQSASSNDTMKPGHSSMLPRKH